MDHRTSRRTEQRPRALLPDGRDYLDVGFAANVSFRAAVGGLIDRLHMEDSDSIARANECQTRFVELLRKLTDMRKVEWAQSEHEPGFVHCLIGDEFIVFEVRGGGQAVPIRPGEQVAGIVSRCRNVTYLWLEGLHGWDTLLTLLRQAPVNEERFIRCRRVMLEVPVSILERMIES